MTKILSANLMLETSVGMPLTSPFACRVDAGKGSSLTLADAMLCAVEFDERSFACSVRCLYQGVNQMQVLG